MSSPGREQPRSTRSSLRFRAARRLRQALLLLCTPLLSGCATVLSQSFRYTHGGAPTVYGGTRANAGEILGFCYEFATGRPSAEEYGTLAIALADFPLSLIADTAILPITVTQALVEYYD